MSEEEVNDRARQATVDRLVKEIQPIMEWCVKVFPDKQIMTERDQLREKLLAMDDEQLQQLVFMFLSD